MGFTLRITNAPSGAETWMANFAARSFDYDPIADSGWLGISQVWDYPSDPRGATTLRIMIIDADNNLLLHVENLGPVNDGVDYEFDASTRKLIAAAVEPPPVVGLPWIGNIFSFVWDISDWFLSAYQEVSGWIWPFYYLQYPLYGIYRVLKSMLTPITHFWEWAEDIATKVSQVFDLDQITAYFRTWIDYASDAWTWVYNATWNVWNIVDNWWSSTRLVVLAWIDERVSVVRALIDQANVWLAELQSYWDYIVGKIPTWDEVATWWSNWAGNVLAVITGWWTGALIEVQSLIDTAFVERESWWAGWSDFRHQVAEFFTDPLEFLWTLFADWFLGPEE